MADELFNYKKQHDFLICVDSDGCAMDTMDVKHIRYFGPCMVKEWGLEQWQDQILARWNEINLYTLTRGVNRFKGLCIALSEITKQYQAIPDIEALLHWGETASVLSEASLKKEIEENPDHESLQKAFSWSQSVNKGIETLPESDKKAFEGVREALKLAHEVADIAIVSSANREAVLEEWALHGLVEHTDIVMAQDAGTKKECIRALLQKGYATHHVLMIGDAPGDMEAAQSNGVFYYPILVGQETESWQEFSQTALEHLLKGTYEGTYAEEKTQVFMKHLKMK